MVGQKNGGAERWWGRKMVGQKNGRAKKWGCGIALRFKG
jgi:hypothetical protein